MLVSTARALFTTGALKSVLIMEYPMESGYCIILKYVNEHDDNPLPMISTKRGGNRRYRTLEAAVKSCKEIGFHHMELVL